MPKKTVTDPTPIPDSHRGIIPQSIAEEMRTAYLDYAMSVITARALPDVRDGLKPVHRRILYSMRLNGLTSTARFKKSATVVGDVLGSFHPHGDAAVYESMVKLAQPFSTRYPLVMGQGNFGCFTKDTKVRLADGRNLSFGELVEEDHAGKKNHTFTIGKDGKVVVALIKKPRLTKKDAEIMKVVLDNGEEIRCTLDHKFLLKNGKYLEAQKLRPGTSLMPLYTRLSTDKDYPLSNMNGYEMVLHPHTSEWAFTHHLADEYNIENDTYSVREGKVRHHVDFNKLNNSPDNIKRMHWQEHWQLHSEMAAHRHANDPEYVEKLRAGREAFWDKEENRNAYAKRMSERNKQNWQDDTYREKMRLTLSEVNKQYIQEHPEKRAELSQRLTTTLKRLWQQPEYRQAMNEKIVRANKKRTTNATGKVKFDAVCTAVLSSNQPLTKSTYEKVCSEVYLYGRATSWQTGLEKYYDGEVDQVKAELVGNHKVDHVEFLNEHEDVYDLTIDGTHNFALAAGVFVHNSIDGDSAAAYRYTEAKMSKIAEEMLRDLEKDTVNWRPNFDGTKREPEVLPAAAPNLLLAGTMGIAVGMATNIPPHNLREVADAIAYLIDNPDASTDDLLKFVKGPDFPLGAVAFDQKDIAHAYASGKGGVVVRGEAEIVEDKKGNFAIIITSIPYRVNKADMLEKIANLVREKRIEGIKEMRDESTADIRVVIELKNTGNPQTVLNKLYKHTELESTFHYNMVALVDGVPQTLSLKTILEEYVKHRQEVVRRRAEYDLRKAKDREHILLGLKKALDHIDEIIKLIRASKDVPTAHQGLMTKFKFSTVQAQAILDMRLQKLAGLERKKIEEELAEVQKLIAELEAILKSVKKMMSVVKKELLDIADKYGDDRRTKIVKGGVKNLSAEDLVADEESVLVLTRGGYIKRTNPAEYRTQKRGGVGVVDLNTKEEDVVTTLLTTSSHSDLLFFTDQGKVYQSKMYEIPEGRRATKGKSIMNFLSLTAEEKVTSVLAVRKGEWEGDWGLLMVTKNGVAKKSAASAFKDVRRSGLIAINLHADDALIAARFVGAGDEVSLITHTGQQIRFKESDVRQMGRTAAGVSAMKLKKGDHIVAADVFDKGDKDKEILVVMEKGFGKTTSAKEYKVQKRGGSGIKTAKVTSKTGNVIGGAVLNKEDKEEGELVVMSRKGQVIKMSLRDVPLLGRDTQGVKIMRLREGDAIASIVTF